MTIGELRDRVTIQHRTTTPTAQGGRTSTAGWVTFARTRAKITASSGGEGLQQTAIRSTVKYVAIIRYRTGVTPSMRISWRPYKAETAKTLEIHGVADSEGQRVWLTLDCAEVA